MKELSSNTRTVIKTEENTLLKVTCLHPICVCMTEVKLLYILTVLKASILLFLFPF